MGEQYNYGETPLDIAYSKGYLDIAYSKGYLDIVKLLDHEM